MWSINNSSIAFLGVCFLAKFIGFSLSENRTLILTMIILIFVYTALLCSILFFCFLGFNKKEVTMDEWKTKKGRGINGGLIKTLSLGLVSDRFK